MRVNVAGILGLVGVLLIALSVWALLSLERGRPPEDPARAGAAQDEMQPKPAPQDAPDRDAAAPADTSPQSQDAPRAAADAGLSKDAPAIDLFRVEADGSALVAGRAAPGAGVDLMLDGVSVFRGVADEAGDFVAMFSVPPSRDSQILGVALSDGGVVAEETFVVQPRTGQASGMGRTGPAAGGVGPDPRLAAGSEPADMASAAGAAPTPMAVRPNGADRSVGRVAAAPRATGDPDVGTVPDTLPLKPAVLRRRADSLQVIQSGGQAPVALDRLSIDTITYDDSGDVSLGGRAGVARAVRVYVNNRPVRDVTTGADGQWRVALPTLAPRVYTLRVDTLAKDGSVLARAETPFRPEGPSALAQLGRDADGNAVALVTVQPGFTLWRIADENYGDGFSYVRVFQANADKIRDPDLIYPGQVFTVPN